MKKTTLFLPLSASGRGLGVGFFAVFPPNRL